MNKYILGFLVFGLVALSPLLVNAVTLTTVVTGEATNVSTTGATINARFETSSWDGQQIQTWFAYNTYNGFGTSVPPTTNFTAASSDFSKAISGLGSGVTYWVRAAARVGSTGPIVYGNVTSFTTTSANSNLTIAVTGNGTVMYNADYSPCSATCSTTFFSGTTATLTATPASGYQVTWGGDCNSSGSVIMNGNKSCSANFTLIPVSPALAISTSSLASGTVDTAYSGTLSATGGTSPYTWSVISGTTLPSGLSLSSAGVISGTSTYAGTYTFSVKVTDAQAATTSTQLSITVGSTYIPPTYETPPSSTSYNLMFSLLGDGKGTVTSFPAGVSCGNTSASGTVNASDCSETYASGTTVLIYAKADSGSFFAGLSGDCRGSSVLMDKNRNCNAVFLLSSASTTTTTTQTPTAPSTTTYTTSDGKTYVFVAGQGWVLVSPVTSSTPPTAGTIGAVAFSPTGATLRRGSIGGDVRTLQIIVQKLGFDPGPIDGIWGPRVEAAVLALQGANNLVVDGLVGRLTKPLLVRLYQEKVGITAPATGTVVTGTVSGDFDFNLNFGQRSETIARMQRELIRLGFLAPGNDSGFYGGMTAAAMCRFQFENQLILSRDSLTCGHTFGPLTRSIFNAAIAKLAKPVVPVIPPSGSYKIEADFVNQTNSANAQVSITNTNLPLLTSSSINVGCPCSGNSCSNAPACTTAYLSGTPVKAAITSPSVVGYSWIFRNYVPGAVKGAGAPTVTKLAGCSQTASAQDTFCEFIMPAQSIELHIEASSPATPSVLSSTCLQDITGPNALITFTKPSIVATGGIGNWNLSFAPTVKYNGSSLPISPTQVKYTAYLVYPPANPVIPPPPMGSPLVSKLLANSTYFTAVPSPLGPAGFPQITLNGSTTVTASGYSNGYQINLMKEVGNFFADGTATSPSTKTYCHSVLQGT